MRRAPLLYVAALWGILGAIACVAAPVKLPTPKPWPRGSYPLELRLSEALSECQRAAVRSAAAWWEARARMRLFVVRDVSPQDPAVLDIPVRRVIGVVPAPALSRPQVVGQADPWLDGATHDLVSVHVELVTCSPRVAAHELAHALGLRHRDDPLALMNPVHSVDAWDVSEAELRVVRGQSE